jgi:predicted RNA-binding Zn-ribbon protein involved in translation (DUF1610 family)
MNTPYIGLTVRQGNSIGLVLGFDPLTNLYDVDFEDGRRQVANPTRLPDVPAEPEVAQYRLANRSERLFFDASIGWDVISADDDLTDPYNDIQRRETIEPQRDLDPAWGLEPDATTGFYPNNPDMAQDPTAQTNPFYQVVPKRNNVDDSFPSLVSANLERCPECGGIMADSADHTQAGCPECGHVQPIDYLARRKQAQGPLIPLELGEAAMGVEGGGSSILNALNSADDLIDGAVQGTPGHGQSGAAAGSAGGDPDMERFRQTQSAYGDPQENTTQAVSIDGRDSDPATSDTNSFEGLNGPEVLNKNVADPGGTQAPNPLEAAQALQSYLLKWNAVPESAQHDPIVRALDESLAKHFPEQYTRKIKSSVEAHEEYMEKVAARKPKMCPFHSDLVDYALELGDPAAATSALSRHMYSPNSCKGGWEGNDPGKPTKCRFKPQMIKQEYWDAKEAEAEERRQLREQQQGLQPQQDPEGVSPEVPEDQQSAVAAPEESGEPEQEFQEVEPGHMVVQDVPSTNAEQTPTDYVPETHADEPTSITPIAPEPMLMAARTAQASTVDGQPLVTGRVYEMRSSRRDDVIPDIVEVTKVTPQNVQIVVKGADGTTYQDSISADQIESDGITFADHEHNPNAHGVPTDLAKADSLHYTGPGLPTDDLDTGGNSHASKIAARAFSPLEQRSFVNEPGVARNLHKLNLAGTHYVQEEDDDLVSWW